MTPIPTSIGGKVGVGDTSVNGVDAAGGNYFAVTV
jgi:hypothetical protein